MRRIIEEKRHKLDINEVMALLKVSRMSVFRYVREGILPKPSKKATFVKRLSYVNVYSKEAVLALKKKRAK